MCFFVIKLLLVMRTHFCGVRIFTLSFLYSVLWIHFCLVNVLPLLRLMATGYVCFLVSSNFSLSWTPFHVNSLLRCVLFAQPYTPLFVCSTIPAAREFGVYTFLYISVNPILQSFWFLYRWLLLIRKLLNHEFLLVKFTSEVSQSLRWLG